MATRFRQIELVTKENKAEEANEEEDAQTSLVS